LKPIDFEQEEDFDHLSFDETSVTNFFDSSRLWNLANETEDNLIRFIDFKNQMFAEIGTSVELWWLVKIIFCGPSELLSLFESKYESVGFDKAKVKRLMLDLKFKRHRVIKTINKLFPKEVRKSSHFLYKDVIMIKKRRE
jgi:hypothetical protein